MSPHLCSLLLCCCCCALWLASPLVAQEPLSEEMQAEVAALKPKAENFFRHLAGPMPDVERAVRDIIGSGPLQDRTDDIKRLINEAETLDRRYGAYAGHEAVGARAVGTDLVFLRYLYKGERFPVVWHFVFYRTSTLGLKREWSLISLRFDTKLEALER